MQNFANRTLEDRALQALLWVFCLSFAFDFRAIEGTGGGPVQYLFLLVALASGAAILAIGRSELLKKPGAFLIALWWGYLLYAFGVSLLNGVPFGRFARVVIPFALLGIAIAVAHIAGCRRMRPEEILLPVFVAALTNILWRVFYGFAFGGVTISTVRIEILSPALNWSFAYIGVMLLFAPGLKKSAVVIAAAAFACVFLSVTRGLIFPMLASAAACGICLVFALWWRIVSPSWALRKMVPIGALVGLIAALIVGVSVVQPTIVERWADRLFDQSNGQSTVDPSLLTRQAEAVAMVDILKREPLGFVYGQGVGGAYYWDDAYYPELWQVYPSDFDFSEDFWFAGHSVWTWSLFSGGTIGVLFYVALFLGVIGLSLASVRANAPFPGFPVAIGFLPLVATCCLLSESLTSNPFDERLAGLMFGMMAGLPQALFTRARDLRALYPTPPFQPVEPAPLAPAPARAMPMS